MPFKEEDVKGKNILVIEDIYDTGSTIMRVRDCLMAYAPKSLKYAVAFHKKNPKNLQYDFVADYLGFFIPDVFVFGYGMDYN